MRRRHFCLILAAAAHAADSPEPIYLGVVASEGVEQRRVVRVMFRYRQERWEALPQVMNGVVNIEEIPAVRTDYPKQVSWTVAFDGRNVGQFAATKLARIRNRTQLGVETPVAGAVIPKIRDDQGQLRPLVLVSRPNFKDPDQWKPAKITDAKVIAGARRAYLAEMSDMENCDGKPCPDNWVKVVENGYRSASGAILTRVEGASNPDTGYQRFAEFERWIYGRDGAFRLMDASRLIDAGDYDGDGVSELLFFEEGVGDGSDSYMLFCPRTQTTARFAIPDEDAH